MPTVTNPHIDPDEIEGMPSSVHELVFIQEFLAQFVDDNAGLFRKVLASAISEKQAAPIAGHSYMFGVDWEAQRRLYHDLDGGYDHQRQQERSSTTWRWRWSRRSESSTTRCRSASW